MNKDGFEETQVTFKKMIVVNVCQSTCLERV